MSKVFIYILIDPLTMEICYVGKALNPITRLDKHINEAKTGRDPKSLWIDDLTLNGLSPIVEIIDVCTERKGNECEKFWIQQISRCNDLLNIKHVIPSGMLPSEYYQKLK